MKTKLLALIALSVLGIYGSSFSQDKKSAKINSVLWLGIDFTASKFTDATEDPSVIVDQYLPSSDRVFLRQLVKVRHKATLA